MRPRVTTRKHFVQKTLTTVATVSTDVTTFLQAVNPTLANLNIEVKEGAVVSAFYVEMWVIGSVTNQFFTAVIAKLPGGVGNILQADLVDLNAYDNKKNILYTTQGLASNDGIAGPIPILRQWFKVPKTKQRFGLGDRLQFALSSRGSDDIIMCGFFMYKEQG